MMKPSSRRRRGEYSHDSEIIQRIHQQETILGRAQVTEAFIFQAGNEVRAGLGQNWQILIGRQTKGEMTALSDEHTTETALLIGRQTKGEMTALSDEHTTETAFAN